MKLGKDKNQLAASTEVEIQEAQEIKSRKLKYGTMATVFTILFIVGVIVVNVLVGYLTDRFVLEFDMTSEDLYNISDDTKEVLADLSEPITISVLSDETDYRDSTDLLAEIYEVLQRYESLSNGMVKVEYINPNINPQLEAKYASFGGVSEGDIVIESAKRMKHLTPTNLYEYESKDTDGDGTADSNYVVGLRAEQRLTSGIIFVTAEDIPSALFTTGHGENTTRDEMESILTNSNYEVGTVNLATEDIPEGTTMLILSAPTTDFTDAEIEKLDAFLTANGNAIVSMDPSVTETLTNLERYFEEWGVSYEKSMVFDAASSLSGYPTMVVPSLQTFEGITDTITTTGRYSVVVGARPITRLFEESSWRTTTALMTSSSTSFAKSSESGMITTYDREADDAAGPFNLTVMAIETHVDNMEYSYSRILFCNAGMISDSVLATDNMLNAKYTAAAINFMTDETDAVIIAAKNYESTTLSILGSAVSALFWVLIIIIPFGLLALGLVIWLRRRHL